MASFVADFRYTVRRLVKKPGFAAAVVLILALGFGANTAIFAILNHVLLKKPPFPEPEQLMKVYMTSEKSGGEETSMEWSYPYFTRVRDGDPSFEDMAAFATFELNLAGTDQPERLPVEFVSQEYFKILGIQAERGRVFLPEEDEKPGTHPVMLISHGLWQRRFGGDENVVGKVVQLDKTSLTVIGVLPAGFSGLTGYAQGWVPMMMAPELTFSQRLNRRYSHWHGVVGRLKSGMTGPQAERELRAVLDRIHEASPAREEYGHMGVKVVPMQEDRIDPALRQALVALAVAMGLVLLVACVNVISLLLVRATARSKEAALRIALGVSRGRLVRLFLIESILLAVLGGLAGVIVARAGIRLAEIFGPSVGPLGETESQAVAFGAVQLEFGVLGISLLLTLVVGVLVGILPALQAARVDVNSWLKEGTGGSGHRSRSLRRVNPLTALVVAEVGLSLVLLIGAGLMLRSFVQLANQDLGVDPDNVLTMNISHAYRGEESESSRAFHEQVLERMARIPGVESVSMTNRLPLSIDGEASQILVQGRDPEIDGQLEIGIHMVGPDHFKTLGVPLLNGTSFTLQNRRDTPRVAILSETAAKELFPREDPIGQRVRLSIGWEEGEFAEVVGVVGDVQYGRIEDEMLPHIYLPFLQSPYPYFYMMVKTKETAGVMMPQVRQALQELRPDLPTFDVKHLQERFQDYLARFRFSTFLLTLLAGLAGLLATLGIYGILAYSISGRTQEFGIRQALGAGRGSLVKLILREGLVLISLGLVAGIVLAFPLTRLLEDSLFGLSGKDPISFLAAAIFLLVVSGVASLVPALRAVRGETKVALRYE